MTERAGGGVGASHDELTFVSHGARIAIRVGRRGLLEQVREVLPPGAVETPVQSVDAVFRVDLERSGAVPERFTVVQDEAVLVRGAPLGYALAVLGNSLHNGVAANAPMLLFVHSGAIAWNGRVLILPGESRCGKSSLVDALVRRGAAYFSDECAPVDVHGHVHPYRKPLWLREDHPRHGRAAFARRRQPPTVNEGLPVGLILFQHYRPDGSWSPQRLTPGQALLRLVSHTVIAAVEPARTLAILSTVVTHAPAFATDRPDADDVADYALRLLEGQISESHSHVTHPPSMRMRSA